MLRTIVGGFSFLIPAVAALLAMLAMQVLKRVAPLLDRAPALVKQAVVLILSAGLVVAGHALGVTIDPQLAQAPDQAMLETLIAAALAHVIHAGDRADRAKRLQQAGADASLNDIFKLPGA